MRILLLGDSTVMGSIPHFVAPKADQFEDVIRKLVESEPNFPPVEVINKGSDGEFVQQLLADRYESAIGTIPGEPLDFIFIRYGINDLRKCADFPTSFPDAYHRLIAQLRRDHPGAFITLETVIPYDGDASAAIVNEKIREIAKAENLPLLDTGGIYAEELKRHAEGMGYRKIPLESIPEKLRALLPPGCEDGGMVFFLDRTYDVHFRDLPGWKEDNHPSLIGYHVLGKTVAEYLIPLLRERYPNTSPTLGNGSSP